MGEESQRTKIKLGYSPNMSYVDETMTTPKPNLLQVSLANAIILSVKMTLFLSVNSTEITDLAQVLGLALASQFLSSYFSFATCFIEVYPQENHSSHCS